MAVKVNGDRGLNFVGGFDISEIEANSKKVLDLITNVQKQVNSVSGVSAGADDSFRKEQLAIQKALSESRLALQRLKEEQQLQRNDLEKSRASSAAAKASIDQLKLSEQELNNQYKAGKIALTEYTLEQRKIADSQRAAAQAQKEAEKTLREQVKLQKEQERQAERNRKQLEKESSEYYKLTTALGNVRKEAKDVQAEMFRLEREGKKASDAYKQLEARSKTLTAQTGILDNGVKRIDASLGLHQRNVGNYGEALTNLSPQFALINQSLSAFGTSISALASAPNPFAALGTSLMAFGKATIAFMLTPVGAIITALAGMYALISANKKTVIEFDAGLRNVEKTAGDSIDNMEAFGDEVISLSNDLKTVSSKEILEIAAAAGQLGVEGTKNLLGFSGALAKLSIASDISGEEGAKEIARFLTLTDGGVENISAFGDEIVNLGNSFAASEKEILSNAERLAQSTGLYKIGRQDVLAYATATKAVGIEAEVVGSSFARTLGQMEKAIRTGNGLDLFAKVTGKSVEGLKKAFKDDAAGVFNDFISGLNGVNKAGGSVQAVLEKLGINAVRDQAVISTLAVKGYGELTDALEAVRDSAGSLDKEFETANKKLENVGKRIGVSWDNLVLSFENGQGIIAKTGAYLGNAFADSLNAAKEVIDNLGAAFGVIKQYLDDLFPSMEQTAGQALVFADSFAGIKALFENFSIREFLKFFVVDIPNSFRDLGAAIDILTTDFKQFFKFLSDAGPELGKYMKDLLNPFAEADSSGIDKLYANFKKQAKSSNQFILDDTKKQNDAALRLFNERYNNQDKRIAESEKKLRETKGVDLSEEELAAIEATKKAAKERLAAQRALQAKIDALNAEANRKQLSQQDQELQAVRDKYAKMRKEIDAFYKDPRNKGLKVDASGLDSSEKKEIERVNAKFEVEAIKTSIAEQKQLFDQFEQYKAQYGQTKAKERFAGEIAEFESYTAYLESLVPDVSDTSVLANQLRDTLKPMIEKSRLEDNRKAFDENVKNFQRIIEATASANTERLRIEEQYQKDLATLRKNLAGEGNAAELAEREEMLAKQREMDLQENKHRAFEQTKFYREMMADVTFYSKKELKERIKELKKALENPDLSPLERKIIESAQSTAEQYVGQITDQFGQAIDETGKLFKNGKLMQNYANAIAGEFNVLADSLTGVNDNMAETLRGLAEVVGISGAAAGSIASFASGDIVGGIQQGVNAIAGIVKIFKQTKETAKEAQRQVNEFYDAMLSGEMEYQALLRERELDNIRRNKTTLAGIEAESNALKQQAKDVRAQYEAVLADLQKQSFVAGQGTEKYGGSFLFGAVGYLMGFGKKTKAVEQNQSLQGFSYEELEKLYSQGQLKDKAKEDFEALRELKQELDEIGLTLEDLEKEYKAIFTGGVTASGIGNTIIDGFKQGKRAVEDFAGDAEDIIRNALLSAIQYKYLEGPLSELIDQFGTDALSNGELSKEEIDAFNKAFNDIVEAGSAIVKQVEEASGVSLTEGDNKSSQNTLSGAIRASLTEETGGKLAGIYQGIFTLNKQMLVVQEGTYMSMGDLLDVGRQSLLYHMQIAQNTQLTYEGVHRSEAILNTIANNTKPGQSGRDMGVEPE
ncbi:phage tail tape measure protein [Pontibacter qinzhouensis]|uniref:Phage tail tape measure protein n=1 Tax=Pontibacter qinzhouensis TaxID=2603253 RepID=A0A5C8KB32_9BACT|nr:phage tail tape measure protein [Pontibacter qinzhouensis]TXK52394.1 phage tail tape measure protein [Pontibacter qinzhouensis]